MQEAKAERKAISLQKEKKDVEFLKSIGLEPAKNATLRRSQLKEYFMKESESETS